MITLDYLKNHPEHVVTCATWAYESWGKYNPSRPLEDYIEARQEYLNDNSLPLTFLALDGSTPVGMCSLTKQRGKWTEYSPWLAALYVRPDYQNRGVGTMLEKAVCEKAKEMGFKKLHLFMSDSSMIPWYEKLGWRVFRKDEYLGPVTLMEKQL